MAITNYSELKSTIADFLNRDDLTTVIPTFITLAEAQVNRDVRHWRMEERADITAADGLVALPADWVSTLELEHVDSDTAAYKRQLTLFSDQEYSQRRYNSNDASGDPVGFRHAEGKIELFPRSGTPRVSLRYVQKVPALSDANTSNWLLADSPDVYLYGALIHTAPYLVEDNRLQIWAQLYSAAVQRANAESDNAKTTASTLTMRTKGMNVGAYKAKHYQFRG